MVRAAVLLEADVEARLVAVERVRVLHDELANAQQPAARPRLLALLRREVVPGLRQLAVRLNLARVERHRLLVGERQHERPSRGVLELDDLWDRDTPGLLPQLRRCQNRAEHLLGTDGVHLLADDLDDLLVDAPAERQERPQPCADLPDEAAPHEQLVARGLSIGRVLAQSRQEEP